MYVIYRANPDDSSAQKPVTPNFSTKPLIDGNSESNASADNKSAQGNDAGSQKPRSPSLKPGAGGTSEFDL